MPGDRGFMRSAAYLCALLFALVVPAPAVAQQGGAKAQVERQEKQPLNNKEVWTDVRRGENPYQTTQVRGIETNILVQTQGEIWRQLRNGPITVYGGWLLVLVPLLIGLFYWRKGTIKLHDQPTGRRIERFSAWDRIVHWTTAISFVILAVTGLIILFGKYVVLPLLGPTVFSWLATLSKLLHNFVGPVFAVFTLLMFITFVKDNLPRAYDLKWFAKFGGLFSGEHVPSGRFNAGEKSWFWFGVILLGIVVSVTGFVLDFPNFAQGRVLMQQANVIHAIAAVLFMALSLAHIYLGTIGMEGAYESMRQGYVDETWAREHHEYWYNDVMAGKGMSGGAVPAAAKAAPAKEGWKL